MHNRFRDIFGAIDKWNRKHLTKAWIKTVLYFGSIVRREPMKIKVMFLLNLRKEKAFRIWLMNK
jgi:hypothetical protein